MELNPNFRTKTEKKNKTKTCPPFLISVKFSHMERRALRSFANGENKYRNQTGGREMF